MSEGSAAQGRADVPPATAWRRILRLGRNGLALLLGVELFLMMTLTFADVLGRYGLNAPLAGAKEMTEILLGLVVFGAAPLVTADRTHVTTSLFDEVLKGRLLRLRDVTVALVGVAACAILAWRLYIQAEVMARLAGGSPFLGVPMAPVFYFMAAMAALCAAIALFLALIPSSQRAASRPAPPHKD